MKAETPKKTIAKRPARTAKAASAEKSSAEPKPKKASLEIPSILLEGDTSPPAPVSGPGRRYALGPTAPAGETAKPVPAPEPAELPEAYGTGRLLLTARDPHWLYAHWDLTREQLKKYNALSADRHLVLRIFKDAISAKAFSEIHLHPESKNWFVHVGSPATKFLAELGYYQRTGRWVSIATSAATLTPPDTMSDDLSVWFETLPPDLQFEHLLKLVKTAVSEHVPLLEAVQQLRAAGFAGLPDTRSLFSNQWTQAQERALAEVVRMDATRRVWMGSLEITELIRRQLAQEISSLGVSSLGMAQFAIPSSWSGALASISSPYGPGERRKGFWFNVNAELIIYGATEPDAKVTIGERPIKLRPDGTFSYRFALPDGRYDLPAVATSADATDSRSAALHFKRETQYGGEVGQHPQDPALKPPKAENVS
jgi:hypothetical protein